MDQNVKRTRRGLFVYKENPEPHRKWMEMEEEEEEKRECFNLLGWRSTASPFIFQFQVWLHNV